MTLFFEQSENSNFSVETTKTKQSESPSESAIKITMLFTWKTHGMPPKTLFDKKEKPTGRDQMGGEKTGNTKIVSESLKETRPKIDWLSSEETSSQKW
jgi:hypothetical protein